MKVRRIEGNANRAWKKIGRPRRYGEEQMISGQIEYEAAAAAVGKTSFEAKPVQCAVEDAANKPIFGFKRPENEKKISGSDITL